MSLSRRGCDGSDIYVYESDYGFCCDGCSVNSGKSYTFQSHEAIKHLKSHIKNNDKVPQHLIDYFDSCKTSGLISNVTEDDLKVIPIVPRNCIELTFRLLGQTFGLGLDINEHTHKNIDKLFSSAKVTILDILDKDANLTKENKQ